MKFRFGNGFSVSWWAEEVVEVEILETIIKYTTPSGKKITIRVPESWTKQNSKSEIDDLEKSPELKNQAEKPKEAKIIQQKRPIDNGLEGSQSQIKLLESEISKLKSAIEEFKLERDISAKQNAGKFDLLMKDQENYTRESRSSICQDLDDLHNKLGDILIELDENDEWRSFIHNFLGIESCPRPSKDCGNKHQSRGKHRHRR